MVIVEFALTAYPINLSNEISKGEVVFLTDASSFAQGVEVAFTVTPKSGWKTVSVKYNGETL